MVMMRALLLLFILLYRRLLQQGLRHSLILKTNALLLRRPPLHKLSLGLQFRLLCLYIPERLSSQPLGIDRRIAARLALQLLDFGKGDWHARGRLLTDRRLYRRQSPHVPAAVWHKRQ